MLCPGGMLAKIGATEALPRDIPDGTNVVLSIKLCQSGQPTVTGAN